MKKPILLLSVIALSLASFVASAQTDTDSRFMRPFTEEFDTSSPQFFSTGGSALRYLCGVPSFTEKGTDVMLMRISPSDPAGAGRGPEIATHKSTHFGTYSARIRVPDVKKVQPNVGAVVGYFTYRYSQGYGLSEIDFEWLIADPRLIYIGTWTSDPNNVNNLQRVGRTINLATGQILYTNYRSYHDGNRNHNFDPGDDAALSPRTLAPIEGYDASKSFYVYGFDWYPNRLTWWIEHPETQEKIILWDYQGSTPNFSGIPQPPTTYLLNFWHTNDWSVDTNPRSTEAPKYPYSLEIDWMKYEPYDAINMEWREKHNW
jgi:hypothetical protein